MSTLNVGPILGLESDIRYTVCFSTAKTVNTASITADGKQHAAEAVGETASSTVWRVAMDIQPGNEGRHIAYQIKLDGELGRCQNKRSEWMFYVPGKDEHPQMVYASCNGFSSLDLMHKTKNPYYLWQAMAEQHRQAPFALLIMGGDQLYGDSIWTSVRQLESWNQKGHDEKVNFTPRPQLRQKINQFYDTLYQQRWNNEHMSLMLASIPSVMMWDDHDIFDGWGSYPPELQECPVFQAIFEAAKHHFELFQVRSRKNTSLLDAQASHYAFAFRFRAYHVLGLDNRAERALHQVMSEGQWSLIKRYLNKEATSGHLLVMSGVPVVYRDFSFTEGVFEKTPWEEDLTDDLKDHWRAKEHQGERARLIHCLLDNVEKRNKNKAENNKTIILSGDVHIGCVGVIHDMKRELKIHQVVSSGIVHPAPSRLQWMGIMTATNDREEYLDEDKNTRIAMLTPFASDRYIRQRNYVTLQMGSDKKLWVNWVSEGNDKPYYPVQ